MASVGEQQPVKSASIGSGHFATMLAAMVLVVVLSSIGASKAVVFGPVITDAAFFLFPLAYILGQTAFGGLDFVVGPGTLVPRPDSEVLVETARRLLAERGSRGEVRLLDTCTGSGAIGICLAWQLDQDGYRVRLSLVDREADALAWARRNSRLLPERVALRVIQADLFPGDEDPYDLVTANPPYIPSDQIDHLMPEVSVHEPRMALDGGPDGLAFYRRLAGQAPAHLRRDGFLVLEHGYDQADAISAILSAQGFAVRPAVLDFGGHLRVTAGQAVR